MISVVIPAFNEEKSLADCLTSLTAQETNASFEVIVVNNNSTDKTQQIAESFLKHLDLKIIHEGVKGRGRARSTGFTHAKGNIIFSTDADAILPPDWIETFMNALQKTDVIGVTGDSRINDSGRYKNTVFNFLQPIFMRTYRVIFGHYWLSGYNSAITNDAYIKAGGFNIEINGQEDIELSQRVSKLGKITYVPHNSIYYSGRRFKNGLMRGIFQYHIAYIQEFFLHKKNADLPDIR